MKPHYTNTNNPVDFPKTENVMNERIFELAKEAQDYAYSAVIGSTMKLCKYCKHRRGGIWYD